MRCFLVSSFLADVTQQIHSLRASGVISAQTIFAMASDAIALLKSAGRRCTGPGDFVCFAITLSEPPRTFLPWEILYNCAAVLEQFEGVNRIATKLRPADLLILRAAPPSIPRRGDCDRGVLCRCLVLPAVRYPPSLMDGSNLCPKTVLSTS